MDDLPPAFDREMTVGEFLDARPNLPDAGQWAELEAGRVVLHPPAEVHHGDVVGNVSAAMGRYVSDHPGTGISLFRQPLQIPAAAGATVRVPAMSWVSGPAGFAAMDAAVLTEPPPWVVEIAGHRGIRNAMADRSRDYLAWGVRLVWIIDPDEKYVFAVTAAGGTKSTGDELASAAPVVEDFAVPVAPLFREPESWSVSSRNGHARTE